MAEYAWVVASVVFGIATWVSYGYGSKRGYALALDHVAEMTRPKLTGAWDVKDAIRQLREESSDT